MSWNYRIVRSKTQPSGDDWFEVCEVYYDEDGLPWGYVDAGVVGETVQSVRDTLAMIAQAFDRPVLNVEDITAPSPHLASLPVSGETRDA